MRSVVEVTKDIHGNEVSVIYMIKDGVIQGIKPDCPPFEKIEVDTLYLISFEYKEDDGLLYTVNSIGYQVMADNISIDKFIICPGIDYVAEGAFFEGNINKVVWNSSCKRIPTRCFRNSTIQKVIIPEGVEIIEDWAFGGCRELRSISLPLTCTTIGDCAFYHSALKQISGQQNVTKVGSCAFEYTLLKSFDWPEECGAIPGLCFANCRDLKEINISTSVITIEIGAFNDCTSLKKVDLSNCVYCRIEGYDAYEDTDIEFVLPFYCDLDTVISEP